MSDEDVVEERDGYRVRLEHDDSPEQPYDDGAVPILTVERYRQVEAFNSQAEDYVHAVTEILDRHDYETLERFVKIFYGAVKMDRWYSDGLQGHYIAFDTAAWREKVGAPEDRLKDEDYLSEVRAWAEGEVYGYIVEKHLHYTKTYAEDPEYSEEGDEWAEVQETGYVFNKTHNGYDAIKMGVSCWGFYGREYAEQAAREALESTIASETKEESVRGCSCGEADHGAPGHEGHEEESSD